MKGKMERIMQDSKDIEAVIGEIEAMMWDKGSTSSDLISRQKAIDELWKALYDFEDKMENQFQKSEELDVTDWSLHRIFVQKMSDIDRQTILNLPSVKPKTGKWLYDKYYAVHVCSECDKQALEEYTVNPHTLDRDYDEVLSSYCPNCGVKMIGVEEEEDEID